MLPRWISVWMLHSAFILTSLHFSTALQFPQTANLSSTWFNNYDGPILVSDKEVSRPTYSCGFYDNGSYDDNNVFGVVISDSIEAGLVNPQLVWYANGNKPVKYNAKLQLTSEGDLILRDFDGSLAWSSNTAGKSIAGLNMTIFGNLVLFDVNNAVVWQSFHHPTDTLVQDQILAPGQELRSAVSDSNWTRGLYSLSVTKEGLFASVKSDPPQVFHKRLFSDKEGRYAQFRNGSLEPFLNSPLARSSYPSPVQFLPLAPDGHLKVYELSVNGWNVVDDLLTRYMARGDCSYPLVCGRYGICTNDNQCSCPPGSSSILSPNYFKSVSEEQPKQGCSAVTPLNCEASKYQSFITLEDVTYFSLRSDIKNTYVDRCKKACLQNCSCKAAKFSNYLGGSKKGSCSLLTGDIFSFMRIYTGYNVSTTFIKVQNITEVQNTTNLTSRGRSNQPLKVGIGVGSVLFSVVISVLIIVVWRKRHIEESEEDYLDMIEGMPSRFSFEELKIATENFSKKLGQGGFGSVFEGVLRDGTKVAVKYLHGIGQVKRSFLAEVESIGSIHHVNLARLVGFCAEKTQRLLVYEYMVKGSLDRWIYNRSERVILDWECRRKIVHDISKGLAYLHEECRHKILHLDIKPQNILLDDDYSAKLSDFGLAKLIDRNQSKVVTGMRGTPGYLAPEWLTGVITEKVDVYSFGVVLLELLCGRKHFDESEPEESMHLLSLFKVKAKGSN